MGNFAGNYQYPIRLIGNITAYQGNKVSSNNWMNNIYNRIQELGNELEEESVHVQFSSNDKELNILVAKLKYNNLLIYSPKIIILY